MKTKKYISILFSCALILSAANAMTKPPKSRISMEQAQRTATQVYSGIIESKELEFEHGQWIYSFDMRGGDKLIHEVQIDAKTGKLVSHKTESSKKEAREKAREKN